MYECVERERRKEMGGRPRGTSDSCHTTVGIWQRVTPATPRQA